MSELNVVLGWGSPVGLGIFLAALGAWLFLLSQAIGKLSQIDREQHPEKYSKK